MARSARCSRSRSALSCSLSATPRRPRERRRWMWVAWAAMAAATLSKGLIGIVIPGASLVLYTLLTRDLAIWRRLHLVSGAALFLALDRAVVHRGLARQRRVLPVLLHSRALPALSDDRASARRGVVVFRAALARRDAAVAAGAGLGPRCEPGGTGTPTANGFSWQRFALVWSAFVFVFFSASGSKLPSYILPMFPVLALRRRLAPLPDRLEMACAPVWPVAIAAGAVLLSRLSSTIPSCAGSSPTRRRWCRRSPSAPGSRPRRPRPRPAASSPSLALRRRTARGRTIAVLALALVDAGRRPDRARRLRRIPHDPVEPRYPAGAEAVNGPFAADAPFYHVHMYDQTVPFTCSVRRRSSNTATSSRSAGRRAGQGVRDRGRMAPGMGGARAGLRDDARERLRAPSSEGCRCGSSRATRGA